MVNSAFPKPAVSLRSAAQNLPFPPFDSSGLLIGENLRKMSEICILNEALNWLISGGLSDFGCNYSCMLGSGREATEKKMLFKYEFFPKASDPPPPLLEFSRHFFQWCLLQVFNAKIIMILELVMGKVISTLSTTSSITRTLPQNCPKTASKLPQNCLKTFGFLLNHPPFGSFEAQKKCLKTFESVKTKTRI